MGIQVWGFMIVSASFLVRLDLSFLFVPILVLGGVSILLSSFPSLSFFLLPSHVFSHVSTVLCSGV